MADFNSKADVEQWVADHGGDIRELEWAVNTGVITGKNQRLAVSWLSERDGVQREATEAKNAELTERATAAAETSAQAAADSATWSRWAAVIATAALVISAWPYIMKLLE